ncbi:MAG: chlorite dismutase family protein [Elusimicrobia bacterium]|nr:chlorite dismutase family protein [Elusimicrobiota bacterium]
MDPVWRRLPAEAKTLHRTEFLQAVEAGCRQDAVTLRAFSTLGFKNDSDFLFWLQAPTLDRLNDFSRRLVRTTLASYLSQPHAFLAMKKASEYSQPQEKDSAFERGPTQYLFVYPFVKSREWYLLPFEERMRLMNEHIAVGHEFPSVRINTSYSFGIDDQDFVVAFESNAPDQFVHLVERLRKTEASRYTARDTPMFVGRAVDLKTILDEF